MVCLCSLLKTLLLTSAFTPGIDWNGSNSAASCAFSGNDLSNSLSKPEECEMLCTATPDCTHYTWTDFNSGTCWLKTGKVSKSDALIKLDQNAMCGIVEISGILKNIFSINVKKTTFRQTIKFNGIINMQQSDVLSAEMIW